MLKLLSIPSAKGEAAAQVTDWGWQVLPGSNLTQSGFTRCYISVFEMVL